MIKELQLSSVLMVNGGAKAATPATKQESVLAFNPKDPFTYFFCGLALDQIPISRSQASIRNFTKRKINGVIRFSGEIYKDGVLKMMCVDQIIDPKYYR